MLQGVSPHQISEPAARFRQFEGDVRVRPRLDVLIVDDDAADTMVILEALKRHPDVGSAQAESAPDLALRKLADGRLRPDLILLDIHMPKLNGFGFIEFLRKIPAMIETPVVLLTTSALPSDIEKAQRSSISLYVVKPDSYDELRRRLAQAIREAMSDEGSI